MMIVLAATKSFLPLCTRSSHTGLALGGEDRKPKVALSALEVKTPLVTADSTVAFALVGSTSAIVIPILSLSELANFFQSSIAWLSSPYIISAVPKPGALVLIIAMAASSLVSRSL